MLTFVSGEETIGIGASDSPIAHGLGVVPQHMFFLNASDENLSFGAANDATNVYVDNADGAATHTCRVLAINFAHSLEGLVTGPGTLANRGTSYSTRSTTITGGGTPDVQTHTLGVVPDFWITQGNYDRTAITALTRSAQTATNFTLTATGAGAANVDTTLYKFHSSVGWNGQHNYYPLVMDGYQHLAVPWDGGPAGLRTITHNLGFTPDVLVCSGESSHVTHYVDSWNATTVDIYTNATTDSAATIVGFKRHSLIDEYPT